VGGIPPWVGAVSTGHGLSHYQGRNGEFCVTVGLIIRTAGILIGWKDSYRNDLYVSSGTLNSTNSTQLILT